MQQTLSEEIRQFVSANLQDVPPRQRRDYAQAIRQARYRAGISEARIIIWRTGSDVSYRFQFFVRSEDEPRPTGAYVVGSVFPGTPEEPEETEPEVQEPEPTPEPAHPDQINLFERIQG